jgi:hypothetical protein
MNDDITFSAELTSVKFTARANPDDPSKTIRRVQFQLVRDFDHEVAEWLGPIGISTLQNMQGRVLEKAELPINGFYGKAVFAGGSGHASADIDGLTAKTKITGTEDNEREVVTFEFETPIRSDLLTFFGASFKEHIEVDIKRDQQELELEPVTDAVKKMAASMPKGTSVVMEFEGKSATLEWIGEVRG